ncbi:MAG: DUF3301 domain-containing protein [Methylococcaceae bacterium]|nr:DUF3301 domain-containing protein [Methylococcaceae bacterium]
MLDFFFIILLLLIGFYWSNAMKAREIAFIAVNVHCQKMDVQLLDEYVALIGIWPKRDDDGKIKAWRSYQFEFTSTGDERYNGKVVMMGDKVLSIQLEPYRIL